MKIKIGKKCLIIFELNIIIKTFFAFPHNEIRYWDLRYCDLYPTSFLKKETKTKEFFSK